MLKSFDLSVFFRNLFTDQVLPDIYDVELFQLHGVVEDELINSGDPCKIRVSPHRFLTVHIFPGLFSVSFWAKNRYNTIKSGFHCDAELKQDNYGYIFDAWDFLLSHGIIAEPCKADTWTYVKSNVQDESGVLLNTTNCGLMRHTYLPEDDMRVISAFYSPNRFMICSHEIQRILFCVPVQPKEQATYSIIHCLNQGFKSSIDFTENDWNWFLNALNDAQADTINICSTNCSCLISRISSANSQVVIKVNTETVHEKIHANSMDNALKLILKFFNAARNDTMQNLIAKVRMLGI